MTSHPLYDAAVAADDAWSQELKRLFGPDAGDVRYTRQGRSGSTLEPLYAAFRRTSDAWYECMKQHRNTSQDVCVCDEGACDVRSTAAVQRFE